jgi:hypothetical protein
MRKGPGGVYDKWNISVVIDYFSLFKAKKYNIQEVDT